MAHDVHICTKRGFEEQHWQENEKEDVCVDVL